MLLLTIASDGFILIYVVYSSLIYFIYLFIYLLHFFYNSIGTIITKIFK